MEVLSVCFVLFNSGKIGVKLENHKSTKFFFNGSIILQLSFAEKIFLLLDFPVISGDSVFWCLKWVASGVF